MAGTGTTPGSAAGHRAVRVPVDLLEEVRADENVEGPVDGNIAMVLVDYSLMNGGPVLMRDNKVHHLPVVSSDGYLEGIVSTFDLIGWFADQ